MIAECPLNFECRVVRKDEIGHGAIYVAEILETHANEELLTASGEIGASALDPLIFALDGNYSHSGVTAQPSSSPICLNRTSQAQYRYGHHSSANP